MESCKKERKKYIKKDKDKDLFLCVNLSFLYVHDVCVHALTCAACIQLCVHLRTCLFVCMGVCVHRNNLHVKLMIAESVLSSLGP